MNARKSDGQRAAPATQAEAILSFYKGLRPRFALPAGISIMNPYKDEQAWAVSEQFYRKFYGDLHFTALSPLGYVRDGKNLNYYDDKELLRDCEPFVLSCIRKQLATMPAREVCFCLGEGENYKYFSRINASHGFFKEIVPLPHPRFVMQYRRKRIDEYVDMYLSRLRGAGG